MTLPEQVHYRPFGELTARVGVSHGDMRTVARGSVLGDCVQLVALASFTRCWLTPLRPAQRSRAARDSSFSGSLAAPNSGLACKFSLRIDRLRLRRHVRWVRLVSFASQVLVWRRYEVPMGAGDNFVDLSGRL